VAHATTPFVTTYTWYEQDGWDKIPNPTSLPASNALDAAMKVFDGKLYLAVVYSTAPRLSTYIYDEINNIWVSKSYDYVMPNAGNGVDFEEWEGDFYLSVTHTNINYMSILKWNEDNDSWENQSNFLPVVKVSNASRNTLYNHNGSLFFAMVSLDSINYGRLSIFKREGNVWLSYYSKDIIGQILYGLRFFAFDNQLYLTIGSQFAPFFKMFVLKDNEFTEAWSKEPLEYYSRVGIAKQNGNKGEEIQIYITKR
jgi:hypothetical protein